jgi:hypothetical protein
MGVADAEAAAREAVAKAPADSGAATGEMDPGSVAVRVGLPGAERAATALADRAVAGSDLATRVEMREAYEEGAEVASSGMAAAGSATAARGVAAMEVGERAVAATVVLAAVEASLEGRDGLVPTAGVMAGAAPGWAKLGAAATGGGAGAGAGTAMAARAMGRKVVDASAEEARARGGRVGVGVEGAVPATTAVPRAEVERGAVGGWVMEPGQRAEGVDTGVEREVGWAMEAAGGAVATAGEAGHLGGCGSLASAGVAERGRAATEAAQEKAAVATGLESKEMAQQVAAGMAAVAKARAVQGTEKGSPVVRLGRATEGGEEEEARGRAALVGAAAGRATATVAHLAAVGTATAAKAEGMWAAPAA